MTILRQLMRIFLMDGLRMMKVGMPDIACCVELKRHRPPGMPEGTCWSFLDIFWNLLSENFVV